MPREICCALLASSTVPPEVAQIKTPVLFVTGEHDQRIMVESVRILAHTAPNAVGYYAPGVHHGWNGEDPDLFNRMARAWIEETPLPDALIPVG